MRPPTPVHAQVEELGLLVDADDQVGGTAIGYLLSGAVSCSILWHCLVLAGAEGRGWGCCASLAQVHCRLCHRPIPHTLTLA